MSYISYHADLKDEAEEMTLLFKKLDKNGDQRLCKDELRNGFKQGGITMTEKELDKLFDQLDTDKTGFISYSEYLAGARDISILANEKYLEDAFNFFDKDKKNYLDRETIKNAMSKGWICDTQLDKLFEEVDTNKDDKVIFFVESIIDKLRGIQESDEIDR